MSRQNIETTRHIVIVGGGSAGWITAGILASEYASNTGAGLTVTLVESPDVQTIGVGEGTWPTMRATLQKIGIPEAEFLVGCSASFKQGTKFVGWVSGETGDHYYHPFSVPAGYPSLNLVPHWQKHRKRVSFGNATGVQGYLCDKGLAPKQAQTPEYAAVANYAYHLDAGKFASLLRDHCVSRLGVRHVLDHVTSVNGNPDANIVSLSTASTGDIEGDLFIDCTGFTALLLGKHYGIDYLDKKHILFNDSALAAQVPYPDENAAIASQTNATAQAAGWIWDIGLNSRRGIGYAYSSAHCSDVDAELALRKYFANTGAVNPESIPVRKISFRPGHREKFWYKNCVAVGLSAGFLEPLEASALVLVELAASMIAEDMPAHEGEMDIIARRFNEKFLYRWDRIIDFLKLHYVLSKRDDSDYWKDNRLEAGIPGSLRERLQWWQHHYPGARDFPQVDEVFSAASHQYVLYGMGFVTEARINARNAEEAERAEQLFMQNRRKAVQLAMQLPDNRALLGHISKHGLPLAY